ncbi:hypothetical protein ACMAY6_09650 [Luminiphilus sp. nBUS_16]
MPAGLKIEYSLEPLSPGHGGTGRGIALALAQAGASVCIADSWGY